MRSFLVSKSWFLRSKNGGKRYRGSKYGHFWSQKVDFLHSAVAAAEPQARRRRGPPRKSARKRKSRKFFLSPLGRVLGSATSLGMWLVSNLITKKRMFGAISHLDPTSNKHPPKPWNLRPTNIGRSNKKKAEKMQKKLRRLGRAW